MVCAVFFLFNEQSIAAVDSGLNSVTNKTIAVIVNVNDERSKEIADYYKKARMIPDQNIVYVSFDNKKSSFSRKEFFSIFKQVNKQVSDNIQAFVLTWTKPYKVECMSITSAFAMGFDDAYCAKGCKVTQKVDYFNAVSHAPYSDHGIRPTMMLAGKNIKQIKQLIDRGLASDYSRPVGDAYLLSSSDKERNVRSVMYSSIAKSMNKIINIHSEDKDFISDRDNVLFYFTGSKYVQHIDKNNYLPGAIGDHLTSAGGVLFGGKQMSVLRWLEAGVTASYGTVVEPCNYLGKFPNPGVMMSHYMNGDSLIEAYWKSVSMPGQGLFVGEPLASPFKGCRIRMNRFDEYIFNIIQPLNYVEISSKSCH